MKQLLFLSATFLLTSGAFAANVAEKAVKAKSPGGDTEGEKISQAPQGQGQVLLFDLSRFNGSSDSTATIGTFGNADRLHKISPDMFRENKGL